MKELLEYYNNNIKILHRGDSKDFLENSIESLLSALNNNNYNGFETDIQLSKDNEWIIFHDYDLKRLSSINKKIKDIKYEDLPLINFKNKNYKISKLNELTKLNDKKIIERNSYYKYCLFIIDKINSEILDIEELNVDIIKDIY